MFQSPHIRLLVDDFPACFRFYRDIIMIRTAHFRGPDGNLIEINCPISA